MSNQGDIFEAIKYCKEKYSSKEDQSKWVKGMISIIIRDNGDSISSLQCQWSEYNVLLRAWYDCGRMIFYYELYRGVKYVGNGLECTTASHPDNINVMEVMFCSNNTWTKPIVPQIYNENM